MVYETLDIMEKIVSLILQFYLIALLEAMLTFNWGIFFSIFIPLLLFILGWIAKVFFEIYQERKRLIIRAEFLKVCLEALKEPLTKQAKDLDELEEKINKHDILKTPIKRSKGLNTKFYSAELLQDIHYLLSLTSTNGHIAVQQLTEMVERIESIERETIYNMNSLFEYIRTQEQNIIKLNEPIGDYLFQINANGYKGLKSTEIWKDIFIKHKNYENQRIKTLPSNKIEHIIPLQDQCAEVMEQGMGGFVFQNLIHLAAIYDEIEKGIKFISEIISDNSESMQRSDNLCNQLIEILDISIENTSLCWPKFHEYAPLEKKIAALENSDKI